MITNAEVFDEGHVPQDMVHRHAELEALSHALSPLLEGRPTRPVVLHGPSGAGKTSTALHLCSQLRRKMLDLETTRVDCWSARTRFEVLYRSLDAVGRTVDVHRSGTSTNVLLDRLRDATAESPVVLILDEVDQLEDTETLRDLATTDNLGLVLIAHREDQIFARLESRTASRLRGGESIEFDSYHVDELTDILRGRAEAGLAPGVVSTEQLRRIADLVAGNAHDAIGTLYHAAREAEQRGLDEITDECLGPAVDLARRRRRETHLDKLDRHQQALLDIITERGEVEPVDLYDAYEARVDDPVSSRMVRNHLQKLDHYDLIDIEGSTSDRRYLAVDDEPVLEEPTA